MRLFKHFWPVKRSQIATRLLKIGFFVGATPRREPFLSQHFWPI
jgi:hypothetical protein